MQTFSAMETRPHYPEEIESLIDLLAVEMLEVPRAIREPVLRVHLAQVFADCSDDLCDATGLPHAALTLCRHILAAVRRIEHAGGGRVGSA
jgi:hypothetical protein